MKIHLIIPILLLTLAAALAGTPRENTVPKVRLMVLAVPAPPMITIYWISGINPFDPSAADKYEVVQSSTNFVQWQDAMVVTNNQLMQTASFPMNLPTEQFRISEREYHQ